MKTLLLILLFSFNAFSQNSNEIIKSIFFGGGSSYIDETQANELRVFIKSLKNLEYYEINIMSHTDNIGSKERNQRLSEQRRKSAIDLLRSFEIPQERMHFKDFGLTAPVFDNNTWEGKINNRRVDIQFKPILF
jgi:outer membrane protein OmpA-like peptidoglycan-associated protein